MVYYSWKKIVLSNVIFNCEEILRFSDVSQLNVWIVLKLFFLVVNFEFKFIYNVVGKVFFEVNNLMEVTDKKQKKKKYIFKISPFRNLRTLAKVFHAD